LFNCNNLEQHGWQIVHSRPHNIVHACRYQLGTTCMCVFSRVIGPFIPCEASLNKESCPRNTKRQRPLVPGLVSCFAVCSARQYRAIHEHDAGD
jgi:hypothetical protein